MGRRIGPPRCYPQGKVPEKQYLVTPGPTPVPPEVLAAMAKPIIHHRTPQFRALLAGLYERLPRIFRTENDVALLTCAGTGAMESAVANLCSRGDPVLVVAAGFFGERWATIAEAYGCDVDLLRYDWGETASADDVAARLDEREAKVVFITHSETSTGVVHDVREIADRIAGSGALVVVDAVSSLGAIPFETDAWRIDVVVTSSHKALMCPPGLALVSVSEAALEATRQATSPRFYLDWRRTLEAQRKSPPDSAFSPGISLIVGLDVATQMLVDEGLEAAYERHRLLGRACRAGVRALGLELFSPDEDRSAVVTAIRTPPEIDSGEIVLAMRERFGVTIIGGQGGLRGKIVRIGHIGYIDVHDVATALSALELALVDAGVDVDRGAAVPAALDAYGDGVPV
jgi:aspartate aminotransferase-like enzyme